MRNTGVLRGLVGVVVAGLVLALGSGQATARPRNPSDTEVTQAQQQRSATASEVGRLAGLVAVADGDMRRSSEQSELAVEQYDKAVVDLQRATQSASQARAEVSAATAAVAQARREFGRFVRASYIQGDGIGSAAALLDASGPTNLLARADLISYAGHRRMAAIGQLNLAVVRRANAESDARAALARQRQATVHAEQAKAKAAGVAAVAQNRLRRLQAQRAALNNQLTLARIKLDGLLGERRRYAQWQHAQAIAAAQAQQRLRRLQAAAAQRLRETAPSGTATGVNGHAGSGGQGWSPARGQRVADAALRLLGTPYAWGGGDTSGPTRGVDGPGAGAHDGSIIGFDCSGLALWAWAQVGLDLPHYSGYQYTSGQHVAVADLRPGDLLFWAYDTSDPATIHHVAIYVGGGQVVQAPQSGDVVRVSSMWFDGYLGATRPGS